LLIAAIASGGGLAVIPGLFLLGFATGCSGFVKRTLDHPGRLALVGSLALAVTLIGFAVTDYETRQIDQWINAGLGMTMALTYVVVIVLLLRTPAEAALRMIFSPLGRTALSNYVGATVIMIGVRFVVPAPAGSTPTAATSSVSSSAWASSLCRWSVRACGCGSSVRGRWRSSGAS